MRKKYINRATDFGRTCLKDNTEILNYSKILVDQSKIFNPFKQFTSEYGRKWRTDLNYWLGILFTRSQ